MRVRTIDPRDRKAILEFIRFPFHLYGDLPHWVPPMIRDQRLELHPGKNPFYEHSDAEFFVAEREGRIVGRVMAMEHRPWNDHTGTPSVLFDHFESEDDPDIAIALFDAVADWGRGRGLMRISGPRRMLAGTPSGILVEGFGHPPALAVPYSLPFYDRLLRHAGFERETDLLSGYVDRSFDTPRQVYETADAVAAEHGFEVTSYRNRWAMWRDRATIAELYNRTFSDVYDFCPLSPAEMELMATRFVLVADPRLALYVKAGDDIAAFLLMLPNVTDAIRRSRGRVLPWGWLRIALAARRARLADIHLAGVLPEYRGLGANVVLYATISRGRAEYRYERAEIVLVDEQNEQMLRNLHLLGGVDWVKRHRVYVREG